MDYLLRLFALTTEFFASLASNPNDETSPRWMLILIPFAIGAIVVIRWGFRTTHPIDLPGPPPGA